MPTAITVFADSVFFLILYLGFRNIVCDCYIRTHSARLEGIEMTRNCATMTSMAPRLPVGLSFPTPSAAKHNLKIASKKTDALPGQVLAFDPQILLTRIVAGKSLRQYQTDDSIFSQGDAADAVFYIQTGQVKLTVVSPSGKEAVIAYLPEKSFFGEGALAGQPLRISTASALQSSTIVRIEKISQETLAEMIGTTRSRVSFFLNRFRDLGFINYNGSGMNINSSLVSVVLND